MRHPRLALQICLMTTAAGSVLALAAPAAAQTSASPAEELEAEAIVVTGARLQNQRAIQAKRDATIISDSISQDEIGRQPDFNIADAVRRIAGVSTVRDEEEGLFLSIRGLNPDFTFVTLDGGSLAALDAGSPGRRVSVETIPSTVISRTDVLKTRNAAMDGNTIGGQVDFTTRSAFDEPGFFFVGSGSIGTFTADNFDRQDNRPAIRLDATTSTRFGPDGQFGIVVAASYFRRDQDEERALQFYDGRTGAPNFPIWNGIESPQTRWGGFAKLEWQPTDRMHLAVSGNYFEQVDDFQRASLVLGSNTFTTTGATSGVGTALYAHNIESLVTRDVKQHYGLWSNLRYDFSDSTQGRLRASYSNGEASFGSNLDNRSDIRFVYTGPAGSNNYSYEVFGPDRVPEIRFVSATSVNDLANYALNRITSNVRATSGEALDLEGVIEHRFGDSGLELEVGARLRTLERRVNDENRFFNLTAATRPTLAQFGRFSESYTAPGAPQRAVVIDNRAVLDFFNQNRPSFTEVATPANLLGNDFTIREEVVAGFVALGQDGDRLDWNVGLRLEATSIDASGFSNLIAADRSFRPIADSNDYRNLLPSAGLTYSLAENFLLRAAYSRALGRANLPDLRVLPSVDEVTGVTTVTGGNTQLLPRIADNFDMSLEYYFDGGQSLLSAALFHKRIDNEIFVIDQTVTGPGGPLVVRQPVNAEQSRLTGFELSLVKNRLDFLPGFLADFGVSANFTHIIADATLRSTAGAAREIDFLSEQPGNLVNLSVFYQSGPIEARASYNYTDRFASLINAANPDGDSFVQPFETIDAQIRLEVIEDVSLVLDGRNLTNAKNFTVTGPAASRIADFSEFGRAFFAGVAFRF